MASQPNIVPIEPELVEFDVVKEIKGEVKLKDGTELELKFEVTTIIKIGYDMNTGIPLYNVQWVSVVKPKHIPKELIKKVQKPGPTGYQ